MTEVIALVGAQFGSEGKGVIAHYMADRFDVHIRTGGPNAGHSFKYMGRTFKQRSVPCGWTNPLATLIIGRGALLDPHVLLEEIAEIELFDPNIRDRLLIDENAWCITDEDRDGEADAGMQGSIGSTLEGVGHARAVQISRNPDKDRRVKQRKGEWGEDFRIVDTIEMLHKRFLNGSRRVLLEGTQGTGLSLIHGQWPYCTSADTTASTLAAMAGIPAQTMRCLMVARTFPIRVAGNSGPLFEETSWDHISGIVGRPTKEQTTVTKKTRRVGFWDHELFERSVWLNAPSWVALTFADYLDPNVTGVTHLKDLSAEVRLFIDMIERVSKCPVALVGTGGDQWSVVERYVI